MSSIKLITAQTNLVIVIINIFLLRAVASGVYSSAEGRRAALDILNFIDSSVNPCDDFYRFTCGEPFNKTHDNKAASLEAMVKNEVDDQIVTMLTKPIAPSEPKAVQGLKKFFKSCIDETLVERNGFGSIKRAMGYMGGWPVVEGADWNENKFNLEDLLVEMRKMGYNFRQLFYIRSTGAEGKSLMIGQPLLDGIEDEDVENYHDYMVNIAVYLGADKYTASSELHDTLVFKLKLLNILEYEEEFERMSIAGLQQQYPIIQWLRFIKNILPPNTAASDVKEIYVPTTEYWRNLGSLLRGTSNRTLANYIMWETIDAVVPFLPRQFREYKNQYILRSSKIFVKEGKQSRIEFCKSRTRQILRPTFEVLYVREHYPPDKREAAEQIASVVKEEFVKLLEDTEVYDDENRIKILDKIVSINYTIGASESIYNEQLLSQYIDDEENISTNDFLTISSILNRLSTNVDLRIGSRVDLYNNFYEEILLPKAFYTSYFNTIVLPAAVLQGLYFNEQRPSYLNFGTIGSILGSELTRGLTSFKDGSNSGPYNSQLWADASIENFNQRVKCLIEQTGNSTTNNSTDTEMDDLVLDEIVADVTGVAIAYRAYENWIRENGEEKQLPGLTYTPQQLFWISAATRFCDTVPIEKLKNHRRAHPTLKTFLAIANNEEFGKDFNCPVGSRMNPPERCQIF